MLGHGYSCVTSGRTRRQASDEYILLVNNGSSANPFKSRLHHGSTGRSKKEILGGKKNKNGKRLIEREHICRPGRPEWPDSRRRAGPSAF